MLHCCHGRAARGRSRAASAARHSDSGHVCAGPAAGVQETAAPAPPRAGNRPHELCLLGAWAGGAGARACGGALGPGSVSLTAHRPRHPRQFEDTPPPERVSFEVPSERRKRVKEAKRKEEEAKQAEAQEQCAWARPRRDPPRAGPASGELTPLHLAGKPNENPDATEDAYKTIFVGRLSYETTESKLRREFGEFGDIKSVRRARRASPPGAAAPALTPPPPHPRSRSCTTRSRSRAGTRSSSSRTSAT